MSARWHVALVRPGQSRLAEEHLRQQSFRYFNPKVVVTRFVRGVRRTAIRQYVPGYIFVRFDAEEDWWYPISGTRGIRRLISAAPLRPIPISEDAMEVMLQRCDANDFVIPDKVDKSLVWLGKLVRVRYGPFENRLGKVEWSNGERVRVVLSFLNSARPVEMRTEDICLAINGR